MKRLIYAILTVGTLTLIWHLFSYKLIDIPPGITIDESAFGYNGVLLANTLHDENDRFLPFFVLSIDGKDWRQPVTQYTNAIAFKIFGSSFYVARSTSVFMMVLSTALIFYLFYNIYHLKTALMATLVFITTPILMIQAHMDLDNIAPVPFTIIWLIGIYIFMKSGKVRYLVLSGIFLGINFYSYKAMRLMVPVWIILTVTYLQFFYYQKFSKKFFSDMICFVLATVPFFAIIPLLQKMYPGAVFGGQWPAEPISYQQFFLGLLSNLDLSFLFIRGDSTPYHSVGLYGSLLLASLPLFLVGAYQSIAKRGVYLLSLLAYLTGPILFSLANSLDRSSRLLALVPPYTVVASLGIWTVMNMKSKFKIFIVSISLMLVIINYADFVNYYWCCYSDYYKTQANFPDKSHLAYLTLSQQAKEKQLVPYIEASIYNGEGETAKFFEAAYFSKPLKLWGIEQPLLGKSILLTNQEQVDGMNKLDLQLPMFYLQVKE